MASWPTQAVWTVIKDIILTFGGLTLIMSEVFFIRPVNDTIIIAGLAMTGLGASFHLGAIMEGFIGRSSSQQHLPPGSSEHSHSSDGSDKHSGSGEQHGHAK